MAKAVSQPRASARETSAAAPADDEAIDAGAGPDTQASGGADAPDTPVNVEGAQNGGAPSAELIAAITAAGGGLTPAASPSQGLDGGAAPQ